MSSMFKFLVYTIILFSLSCTTVIAPYSQVSSDLNRNLIFSTTMDVATLPAKLTMFKAKEIALRENPDLRAAGQRIMRAKAIIDQANSLFSPTVSATAGARHQHSNPQGLSGVRADSYENYTMSLNARWVVYDGLIRQYKVLSAQYNELSTRESFKDAQRLLVDALSQAFYQTVLARKQMDINLELKDINEKFLKDTKIKFDAGTATKTQVNNFIVNVNDAQISYLDAKNYYETSKLILAELLGKPHADMASIETIYKNSEVTVPDLKTAIGTALNKRPDLKSIQAAILATEAQVKEAEGEYSPSVFLEGAYGHSSFNRSGFGDDDRASYFGIGMNWNLFTGGSTAALIAQRIAEKEEALSILKSQWNEIVSQIRQQRLSLENVLNKVKVQSQTADLSKSIYDDTKEVYENGATTITRVNEVLTNYSIARLSQALFEVESLRRREILNALMGVNLL